MWVTRTMNFVVHATIACRNHPQYHESITDSVLTDRVKKYIQSIHKGRKKTPKRKEAKNDRRAIRERQRRVSVIPYSLPFFLCFGAVAEKERNLNLAARLYSQEL